MATGGKGIHVVVPLTPHHGWDDVKAFAEAMARTMAAEEPDRYLAEMSKARRKGKIFIDYLRNGRGATAIAPYSTRARKGAPVAWPVAWTELAKLPSAHETTVENAAAQLMKREEQIRGKNTSPSNKCFRWQACRQCAGKVFFAYPPETSVEFRRAVSVSLTR